MCVISLSVEVERQPPRLAQYNEHAFKLGRIVDVKTSKLVHNGYFAVTVRQKLAHFIVVKSYFLYIHILFCLQRKEFLPEKALSKSRKPLPKSNI